MEYRVEYYADENLRVPTLVERVADERTARRRAARLLGHCSFVTPRQCRRPATPDQVLSLIAAHAARMSGHRVGCHCARCSACRVRAKRHARRRGVLPLADRDRG